MKQFYTMLVALLCLSLSAQAKDYTYDFTSSVPSVWTTSVTPNGFETGDSGRGTQYTKDASLTLAGVKNVTSVKLTYSCNIAGKNTISLSVGGSSWGNWTLEKISNDVKTLTGTAASGNLVISLTRAEKSVWIKQVVVTADEAPEEGSVDNDNTDAPDEPVLDENYTYAEPTVITVSGATCSNQSYSFIQNNIKVYTSTGAQTADYFGCNAGQSITFTATQPIMAITIDGYVKKDFCAEASSGILYSVNATEDEVTANPVVVVYMPESKSVTINCDKQLRCYKVSFYFDEASLFDVALPDTGDDEDDDYNFSYEPTTSTTISPSFDTLYYLDASEDYETETTELYLSSDDYELDLIVFAKPTAGTAIPVGTYPINASYENGTVLASYGGNDYYDLPSFLATDFEYDEEYGWYYNTSYYLESGTLTVAADPAGVKLTLNSKSHYGSTITTTFIGKAIDYDSDEDDDEDAITTVASSDKTASKYLKNGRILIEHNGKTYNTVGTQIK